ncbi:MAG TPA: DUF983 domain-containing protein [Chloroflexota bacterium]
MAHGNGSSPGTSGRRQASFARFARLVWRALRLRCPNCGQGRLIKGWFGLRERCPVCQVWLEREEGYFLGAMAVNLIIGEFVPVFGAVAIVISTWPNPPWQFLQIGVPILMGVFPIVLFPFSRMLWLALDWTFRPPTRDSRLDHPRPGYTEPEATRDNPSSSSGPTRGTV